MTINELLEQGISFQGDRILVIVYDLDKDTEIFKCSLFDLNPQNPARDRYEVRYIYPAQNDTICIEVRKEG